MIRRFWITFYAFALVVLSLVTVAVDWLIVSAFFLPQRSWRDWREWIWLPVMVLPPIWLPWITWRLLRREIARGKARNGDMAKCLPCDKLPHDSWIAVRLRKIPGFEPIRRFIRWFWRIGGLDDVKSPLLLTPFGGWFMVFLSLPLLISATVIFIRSEVFLHRSISAEGTVIRLVADHDETIHYAPVFAYTAEDGQKFVLQSSTKLAQPEFSVGQKVPVLYDSVHPERARIAIHGQIHAVEETFGLIGTVFAGIGFGSLLYQRKRKRKTTASMVAG